jgi:hypothetical protein
VPFNLWDSDPDVILLLLLQDTSKHKKTATKKKGFILKEFEAWEIQFSLAS